MCAYRKKRVGCDVFVFVLGGFLRGGVKVEKEKLQRKSSKCGKGVKNSKKQFSYPYRLV